MHFSSLAYFLKSGEKFLYAGESIYEDHNSITGLDASGSGFRKEGSGDEFELSLLDEKPGASNRSRMYLAINGDRCKNDDPVMEIGGGESVKCKMEGDRIRILSPRQGYLGFNERAEVAVFVEDGKERKSFVCLEFTRAKLEFDKDGNVMRAQKYDNGQPPKQKYDDGQPPPINKPNKQ